MTTGQSLTYNFDTNLQDLKNIYISGLEDIEYRSNQAQIITPNDSDYKIISRQFNAARSGSAEEQQSKKQYKLYSGICLLRFIYTQDGVTDAGYATGFIIGETYIATAAHNYYDPYGLRQYIDKIEVYTAIPGPLGEPLYRKDNVHTVEGISNHTVESDYALMTEQPLIVEKIRQIRLSKFIYLLIQNYSVELSLVYFQRK